MGSSGNSPLEFSTGVTDRNSFARLQQHYLDSSVKSEIGKDADKLQSALREGSLSQSGQFSVVSVFLKWQGRDRGFPGSATPCLDYLLVLTNTRSVELGGFRTMWIKETRILLDAIFDSLQGSSLSTFKLIVSSSKTQSQSGPTVAAMENPWKSTARAVGMGTIGIVEGLGLGAVTASFDAADESAFNLAQSALNLMGLHYNLGKAPSTTDFMRSRYSTFNGMLRQWTGENSENTALIYGKDPLDFSQEMSEKYISPLVTMGAGKLLKASKLVTNLEKVYSVGQDAVGIGTSIMSLDQRIKALKKKDPNANIWSDSMVVEDVGTIIVDAADMGGIALQGDDKAKYARQVLRKIKNVGKAIVAAGDAEAKIEDIHSKIKDAYAKNPHMTVTQLFMLPGLLEDLAGVIGDAGSIGESAASISHNKALGKWSHEVNVAAGYAAQAIGYMRTPAFKTVTSKAVSYFKQIGSTVENFLFPDVSEIVDHKKYVDGALTGPFYPSNFKGAILSDPEAAIDSAGATIFVNGVRTPAEKHIQAAKRLADTLNRPVVGIWNATGMNHGGFGTGRDIFQSLEDKLGVGDNPATKTLVGLIQRHGRANADDGGLHIVAHSQGSIIVSDAISRARKGRADISNLSIDTFGNAATAMPAGIRSLRNFVHDDDVISTLAGSTSTIAKIEQYLPLSHFGWQSTRASTYVLHHGGQYDAPHGFAEPKDSSGKYHDYLSDYPAFMQSKPISDRGMEVDAKSFLSTSFAFVRGISDSTAGAVRSGFKSMTPYLNQTPMGPGGVAAMAALGHGIEWIGQGLGSMFDYAMKAPIQRSGSGPSPDVDALALHSNLQRHGGHGEPVKPEFASDLGAFIGGNADVSQARIHTGAAAAGAARNLRAEAFTIGRDVYFGEGRYQPHTTQGRGLLAHELTHVAQNASGIAQFYSPTGGDFMEAAARDVERQVVSAPPSPNLIVERTDLVVTGDEAPDREFGDRVQIAWSTAESRAGALLERAGIATCRMPQLEIDIEVEEAASIDELTELLLKQILSAFQTHRPSATLVPAPVSIALKSEDVANKSYPDESGAFLSDIFGRIIPNPDARFADDDERYAALAKALSNGPSIGTQALTKWWNANDGARAMTAQHPELWIKYLEDNGVSLEDIGDANSVVEGLKSAIQVDLALIISKAKARLAAKLRNPGNIRPEDKLDEVAKSIKDTEGLLQDEDQLLLIDPLVSVELSNPRYLDPFDRSVAITAVRSEKIGHQLLKTFLDSLNLAIDFIALPETFVGAVAGVGIGTITEKADNAITHDEEREAGLKGLARINDDTASEEQNSSSLGTTAADIGKATDDFGNPMKLAAPGVKGTAAIGRVLGKSWSKDVFRQGTNMSEATHGLDRIKKGMDIVVAGNDVMALAAIMDPAKYREALEACLRRKSPMPPGKVESETETNAPQILKKSKTPGHVSRAEQMALDIEAAYKHSDAHGGLGADGTGASVDPRLRNWLMRGEAKSMGSISAFDEAQNRTRQVVFPIGKSTAEAMSKGTVRYAKTPHAQYGVRFGKIPGPSNDQLRKGAKRDVTGWFVKLYDTPDEAERAAHALATLHENTIREMFALAKQYYHLNRQEVPGRGRKKNFFEGDHRYYMGSSDVSEVAIYSIPADQPYLSSEVAPQEDAGSPEGAARIKRLPGGLNQIYTRIGASKLGLLGDKTIKVKSGPTTPHSRRQDMEILARLGLVKK